jgi:hypothetical protein
VTHSVSVYKAQDRLSALAEKEFGGKILYLPLSYLSDQCYQVTYRDALKCSIQDMI